MGHALAHRMTENRTFGRLGVRTQAVASMTFSYGGSSRGGRHRNTRQGVTGLGQRARRVYRDSVHPFVLDGTNQNQFLHGMEGLHSSGRPRAPLVREECEGG